MTSVMQQPDYDDDQTHSVAERSSKRRKKGHNCPTCGEEGGQHLPCWECGEIGCLHCLAYSGLGRATASYCKTCWDDMDVAVKDQIFLDWQTRDFK